MDTFEITSTENILNSKVLKYSLQGQCPMDICEKSNFIWYTKNIHKLNNLLLQGHIYEKHTRQILFLCTICTKCIFC